MMIGVEVIFFILRLFLEPTRFNYLIIVAIGVIVGAIIYGGITIKTRLADEFLGDIPTKIRRKVKILR
ncbi:MAG: polysaccharide biosynthesis protein, partial [Staphylococcus epidermidis]|nr:polysaccharide biosynthesis protein [Staphylococcus epidermidis]MDU3951718.1 polysaccharide biosynthesis protein [Staphylococcus epidermidis]MDU3980062.1 polysaccharide biosynthesis protein [Staphylococcus epidermidis]MDU6184328.1 polysaccharide biosynthesis protein [Staphylococcus epidermidis]